MNKKHSIILFLSVVGFVLFMCGICVYTGGGTSLRSVRAAKASETDAVKDDKEKKTTDNSEEKKSEDNSGSSDTSSTEGTTGSTEDTTASTQQQTTQYTTTYVDTAALTALTNEYTETLKEKVEVQTKLNDMMESQNSFINKLHEIDDMIIDYQDKIDDINNRTNQAHQMMQELSSQIEQAEAEKDAQYERLKGQIAQEYENSGYTYMDALFNATDYADLVNKSEYIQSVDSYNNTILGQLADAKRRLNDKTTLLNGLTGDLETLEEAYQNEQDTLQILSDEKENQISFFQSSIDQTKRELSEVETMERDQSAKIASMEQTYSVSVSVGVSETGYKYAGGDFLWPMPSSSTISSYYGTRVAPTAGASTEHKGIDISCSMGANVLAAADGKVIYVGYLDSAGNAVIIDHGSNISTCYFHLSAFGVNAGDKVTKGQTIAYAGSTGVSTGPHLHFAVRENGTYVNPLKYFTGMNDSGKVSNDEGGTNYDNTQNNSDSSNSSNTNDNSSNSNNTNDNNSNSNNSNSNNTNNSGN